MNIGEIIHSIRKEKKMTLFDLSQKSGVALATLSRMENGKMTGTLESHINISRALDIALPELYRNLDISKKVVDVKTEKTHTDVFVHDKRAVSEMLASNVLNKKMMPLLIKISKGGSTHREETRINVEKFIYVLSGEIEVNIGQEKYILAKGDTLYFESSIPHHFKNIGTSESQLICVICPPTL